MWYIVVNCGKNEGGKYKERGIRVYEVQGILKGEVEKIPLLRRNYRILPQLYHKITTNQPPGFQGPGVRWFMVVLRSPARRTVLQPSYGDPSPNAVGLGRYGCTYGWV